MASYQGAIRDTAEMAADNAREMAEQAAEKAGPIVDQAQDLIQQGLDTVSVTIKERPLLSIAVVGAFAFTVGALSMLRPSREQSIIDNLRQYLPRDYR